MDGAFLYRGYNVFNDGDEFAASAVGGEEPPFVMASKTIEGLIAMIDEIWVSLDDAKTMDGDVIENPDWYDRWLKNGAVGTARAKPKVQSIFVDHVFVVNPMEVVKSQFLQNPICSTIVLPKSMDNTTKPEVVIDQITASIVMQFDRNPMTKWKRFEQVTKAVFVSTAFSVSAGTIVGLIASTM